MIREEINELFVQMRLIESKPNNTDEFIQIVTDAFTILEKLKNEYYLIPKENIDSRITFEQNELKSSACTNVYAQIRINAKTTIKNKLLRILLIEPIHNNLKMMLIRELEKKVVID